MARTFIDLGLPSGTLWATENEPGYHQFNKAVKTFGEMLPTIEAWRELFRQCHRKWNANRKGYLLTGPNGNTLFLPAEGWNECNTITKRLNRKNVYGVGYNGQYWSSTIDSVYSAWTIYFSLGYINTRDISRRIDGFSVRLCKPAGAQ